MHQFLIFSNSIKYLPIGKYKRLLSSHEQQLSSVYGKSNRNKWMNEWMNQVASDDESTKKTKKKKRQIDVE